MARKRSMDALQAMINIIDDTVIDQDGRTRNREDGRIVVVAAQTILTWGYGKPAEYDPKDDQPDVALNTAMLSREERAILLSMLRRGLVTPADQIEDKSEEKPEES